MIQLRNTTIFFNNLKDIITAKKLFLIIFDYFCGQFEGIYVKKIVIN
jgi:hypothetical protein